MRYILHMLTVFLGDGALKMRAERCLAGGREVPVLNDSIRFKLHHNKGAMLNTGEKHPDKVAFFSLSLCILLTILFIISLITGRASRFRTALALLLGGAWSNTCDRFTRGYVVDYVSFPVVGRCIGRIFGKKAGQFVSNIVFNISDFFIIGGCLFTLIFNDD